MALKRVRGTAVLMLTASIAITNYWYFGIYRASEVRLFVSNGLSPLGDAWKILCILGAYSHDNSTAKEVTGIEIESRGRSVKYDTHSPMVTIND
ncbi:hypothetical protein [Silicimonas sp. MF1-12-2]|uniref:hypothetical protein n=1 Tax=Silicimonas sp. MF1-12-2 TaxID=3384793 RepID=UPI0039B370BF